MTVTDEIVQNALIEKKVLTKTQAKTLKHVMEQKGLTLQEVVLEHDWIPDEVLGEILAELYGVEYVKLSDQSISESLLGIVPFQLASHQHVIPFAKEGDTLKVAFADPSNAELISALAKKTNLQIKPYLATQRDIKASLKFYNRDINQKFSKLLKGAMADLSKIESLQDTAKILDAIILFAFQNNASDIHLEPHKNFLIVRCRMDGILQVIAEFPMEIEDFLITRIKVLANLRTDEHRAAQDGRFKIELENNEITLRVSIIPVYQGEKAVLRLLSSSNQELSLETIGYSAHNLEVIQSNIKKTHGILLMTGPTGSGKTTTLYTLLKKLNSSEINISTIEDPIEYQMEGINQIQVNAKTNLTFADGLRALLRQDPDVIMVGEIRDEETASIAINASLTGHLVLATLHTNDAASTLPRMLDMNVEGFLLAATVQMVIAQRLVRKICEQCKEPYQVTQNTLHDIAISNHIQDNLAQMFSEQIQDKESMVTFYRGRGCATCNQSGYKGRIAIAEVMNISTEMRQLILEKATPRQLEERSIEEGMIMMFLDGIQKVVGGITTLEEVLRVMRV